MKYGYRILDQHEIGLYNGEILQISMFRDFGGGIDYMLDAARKCKSANIRYVLHPIGYFLSETRADHRAETLDLMRTAAENADMAIIIHDETTPRGKRLEGEFEHAFREGLNELSSICSVSIENANNTPDIIWFWRRFADSITLDIGHIEAAGLNSEEFVAALENDLIKKIDFVHLHRNNGPHPEWKGLKDHWGLTRDCRELAALRRLLDRRDDLALILEINDPVELKESIELIEELIL